MSLARTLQFTYAGLTVGGSSGRHIDGFTVDESNPERGAFECVFVTAAKTTDATFATEIAAIEVALSTPRGALVVTNDGNTWVSWSHTSNTGLDGVATITKEGREGDTGLSRRYRFRFECGLPADSRFNTSGRRSGSVDCRYAPSRRRHVTISGVYTALAGVASRAQYVASVDTYASSVMSTLGITSYQLGEEPVTDSNDTDKVITFRRVYDELLYVSGIFADTSIKRAEMKVGRQKMAPGDSPTADRMATIPATFTCWVDSTVTTDLKSKFATIRSTVVAQIRASLELGAICLIDEKVNFDWIDNRIDADLTLQGVVKGNTLELRITTREAKEFGLVLSPAWTGDPLSYYVSPGPARFMRIVTTTKRVLGNAGSGSQMSSSIPGGSMIANVFGADQFIRFDETESYTGDSWSAPAYARGATPPAGAEAGAASGGGAGAVNQQQAAGGAAANAGKIGYVPISWTEDRTPLRLGLDVESQIDVTDITEVSTQQLIKAIGGGGGAPRGGTVVTPDVSRR